MLCGALTFTATIRAQFWRITEISGPGPESNKPVIADITMQIASTTPWGTFTQSLKGKFWRARNGDTRQDADFGTTLIVIVKPQGKYIVDRDKQTQVWMDHDAKLAAIDVFHLSPLSPRTSPVFNVNAVLGGDARTLGAGTVAGHEVVGRRQTLKSGGTIEEGSVITDMWVDPRLGIPMQNRYRTPTNEIFQQLSNIEERDPDPSLFKIPDDYTIIRCKPAKARGPIRYSGFCESYDLPAR